MQAFIGLSSRVVNEARETLALCVELGLTTRQDILDFLGNTREARVLCLCWRVSDNPEMNLWNQHPSSL